MAFQQSDLDALNKNIASGIMEAKYADGRAVRYQSLDHMLAARDVMIAELDMAAQAARGARRKKFGSYRSGL
jgi:hypothetical protein